ncbi:MAG TPA: hypothetical protein VN675_00010 [Burkholderiales bacterium]|nr:hypothetical protein [Burkholderiales bacterium]
MTNVRSWQFWIIIALALATMACAGRRERREQAREERRERAEQRRAERAEMLEQRRAQREQARPVEAAAPPPPAPVPVASVAPPPPPPAPAAAVDSGSRVVFMRVSKQTSGVDASLFDVTEPGEPKFIGVVGSASKLSYPLKPGLYTFMVVGETAEFMQATVNGGKTYYSLVIPKSGATRFAIEPVRRQEIGGKEFQGWDRNTKPMPAAAQPRAYNATDVAEKRVRYWQDWSRKTEAQRAELTINAEDGR